ncbi:MAG: hypothetical protein IKS34_02465, partial [Clostridia bacterium]|nr:hypothetical protein [Clostridia bacterium]
MRESAFSFSRLLRVLFCCLALFALLSASFLPDAAGKAENSGIGLTLTESELSDLLKKEIAYVASIQLSNGAIPDGKLSSGGRGGLSLPEVDGIPASVYRSWPSSRMVSYFSDFACMGVIRACKALGKSEAGKTNGQSVVLNYLEWYLAHMNTKESDLNGLAGTVYDYFIFRNASDGRIVEVTLHDAYSASYPKNNPYDYDSTDSYAAVFLELLLEYTDTFDSGYIIDKEQVVDTLVNVMRATEVKGLGLTGAKPNYMVCYLMDNCEVYRGVTAAEELYRRIGNREKAESAKAFAKKVQSAIISRLYSASDGCWYSGVFENGKPTGNADLSVFYPQGSCQLFPVVFGVDDPDSERAKTVYGKFKEAYCKTGVSGQDWSSV